MLHFLRRAVKSLPAQLLLGLLVVSFAIWGIGDIFTAGGPGTVATVGETEVPADRYADALLRTQRVLSQQQRAAVSLQEMQQAGIADAALAALVRDAALAEELDRLGIAVPPEAVRRAIIDNPAFQDGQGAFSEFLYASRLSDAGYTPQAYEAATRELLGQQLITDAFAPVAAPPSDMAGIIAAHAGEERTIAYVRLTPDMAPEPSEPGEEALAAWFEENRERFREPERRTGLYLHTNLDTLAAELAPTEEELRAEYEAHPEAYAVEPTREVEQLVFDDMAAAQAALERIRSGEASFADIAAERNVPAADLSLGTVTREELPDASAEAVFGVTEPGVAGPVEGVFGPMLLNVTAVQEGGTAPFEQVVDRIREDLAARRAREAAVERANAIDDLRAAGTPLPQIAEQVGLDLVRFEGLDAQGNVAGGEPPPLTSNPAFLAEVNAAMDGEERDVVQLPDGSYALVMVEEIADSHLPELDAVRDRVVEAWKAEQRMQALESRATALAGRIAAEGGLEALATAEGLGTPETASFTRERVPPPFSPGLAKAAFDAEPGGTLVGRARSGDAVLLGELTAIEPLAEDALAEETATLEEALTASIEQDQLEYLGRAIQNLHGAQINESAVEQVFTRLGQSGR
jgi:peptidyl-prolyl cis-trans isomerase D